MPSVKSLDEFQYYAHPQNAFWFIMSELFNFDLESDYVTKLSLIKNNSIALWDVVQQCSRQGSLDTHIKNEQANDLESFIQQHKELSKIIFNGQKAFQLFKKHIGLEVFACGSLEHEVLASSSPAMASLTKTEKLELWRNALII